MSLHPLRFLLIFVREEMMPNRGNEFGHIFEFRLFKGEMMVAKVKFDGVADEVDVSSDLLWIPWGL
jgi:hypothetical protein